MICCTLFSYLPYITNLEKTQSSKRAKSEKWIKGTIFVSYCWVWLVVTDKWAGSIERSKRDLSLDQAQMYNGHWVKYKCNHQLRWKGIHHPKIKCSHHLMRAYQRFAQPQYFCVRHFVLEVETWSMGWVFYQAVS
jgi:hypothetical protein